MKIVLLLLSSTISASLAAFFLKKASGNKGLLTMIANKWFWLGGILYGASALLNICLLQILPYSLVVPLGALSYLWTIFLSYMFLGEKLTANKLAGIAFLLVGMVLIAA